MPVPSASLPLHAGPRSREVPPESRFVPGRVARLLRRFPRANGSPFDRELRVRCRALCAAVHGRDLVGVRRAAQSLIGLGPGLTPSGDDFLVGYLAALDHACLPELEPCRQALRQAITQGLARTSDVSAHYLGEARRGRYAQPVADLVRALTAPRGSTVSDAAARLARVGHTTGRDALHGICFGCRAAAAVWQERA